LLTRLLAGVRTGEELVGPGGLLAPLTQRLVEGALEVELPDHLGYERHQEPPGGTGNQRNGSTPKTVATEHGPVSINTPRDRDGSFEPQLVRQRQRRFEGFDEKILARYARGMSTRDIEAHPRELYGVSVGRDVSSRVTDAVWMTSAPGSSGRWRRSTWSWSRTGCRFSRSSGIAGCATS
jgi:putative transposase